MSSYVFNTRAELDSAVDGWISNQTEAISKYGDINSWDVSGITDFSKLFSGRENFNSDISNWDVSSGKDFSSMFVHNEVFNQDIGDWDLGNGTDFSSMFFDADAFNQDIGSWDVSNGTIFPQCLRVTRVSIKT